MGRGIDAFGKSAGDAETGSSGAGESCRAVSAPSAVALRLPTIASCGRVRTSGLPATNSVEGEREISLSKGG